MTLPCSTAHPRTVRFLASTAAALLLAHLAPPLFAAEPATLKLKDGDVWVMAGDSITAQRQHTNYIEAYYRTRYPKLNLHFANSGIGGNRVGDVLKRFDYDVAAWKPTIVSIELGMNDVNGGAESPEAYIKGMRELIAKIRALPAQPVLISSSPVDDGSKMNDWRADRCRKLHPYTEALKQLAAEENVVFADQYHPLIDLWGDNRRQGAEALAKSGVAPATPIPVPNATPKPAPIPAGLIPLGGDPVHPGPVGQYTMAHAILAQLHAEGEVSSATLDAATGKVTASQRCQITEVTAKDGTLSFTRLDESGPWPILPNARAAVKLVPAILDLSKYGLKVTGLKEGDTYEVSIEGKPAATVTGKELAAGWNMTSAFDGFLGQRATKILGLIEKLEVPLNKEWRAASQAKDAAKLETAGKAIQEMEAEIQKAVQPVPLHIVIAPAKAAK